MKQLLVLSAFALLASAPALAGGFRCSAQGGPQWREYRTRHFIVATDQSPQRAAILIKDLETLYALELQALVGEQVEIPGHVRVLAPASEALFNELAGEPDTIGYFKTDGGGAPIIVLTPSEGKEFDREIVAHELAHHISHYLFPVHPHWYGEGLAAFIQTLARRGDQRDAPTGSHLVKGAHTLRGAGLIPREMALWMTYDPRPIPARDLLAWDGKETKTGARYHLWSWILYHWLWNTRGKQLSDYQRRLSDGEEPDAAWVAALPEFDPKKPETLVKLDEALEKYRQSARYAFYDVKAEADTAAVESKLSSAQVHLLLVAASELADPGKWALAHVDEALLEDPGNPSALVLRAAADKTSPLEALRKSAAARPADAMAWELLGEFTKDGAEEEAALRKAIELNPESSRALNDLAWALALAGRPKEALPFANRAVDLAPWSTVDVNTLAEVAARLGKCTEALALERRAAAGFAREGKPRPADRKHELETRCAAAH